MKIFAALFALVAGVNAAASVPGMTRPKCRTMCQRFGMKALGDEFKSIKHPTECMTKCNEVYPQPSFLQTVNKPAGKASKLAPIKPVVKTT